MPVKRPHQTSPRGGLSEPNYLKNFLIIKKKVPLVIQRYFQIIELFQKSLFGRDLGRLYLMISVT
jgi:hypothetical protein